MNGVVAGLDLDLGEGLEERRLADVRRADERDLGGALAPDGDRIAVDRARPDAGVLDLGEERLAEVRVRTVPVVGQLGEERADLADPLPTLLADQSTLRDLGERPMRHRHDDDLLCSIGEAARGAQPVGCDERHASDPRPFHRRWCWKGRLSRSGWRSVASQAS